MKYTLQVASRVLIFTYIKDISGHGSDGHKWKVIGSTYSINSSIAFSVSITDSSV